MRAAVYVRCSTTTKKKFGDVSAYLQNPEAQVEPLVGLLASRGWELHRVYSDRMSGAKEMRPGLRALLDDARRGLFGVVVVWRFDRFARSVKQLVMALEEFRTLGIEFISHQEALDTSTPMGKAMFTIIAAMAELERSVIRERVMAGLEYAREHGTKSGRPVGRPKRVFDREEVVRLYQRGMSIRAIARHLEIGSGTVVRTLKDCATQPQQATPSPTVGEPILCVPESNSGNLGQQP
jgi:DNA invertase Pin-like site-specific DNA recombinase